MTHRYRAITGLPASRHHYRDERVNQRRCRYWNVKCGHVLSERGREREGWPEIRARQRESLAEPPTILGADQADVHIALCRLICLALCRLYVLG